MNLSIFKNVKTFLSITILLDLTTFYSCEKNESLPINDNGTTKLSNFVDMNWYSINTKEADDPDVNPDDIVCPPRQFFWSNNDLIVMDDVCGCIPSTCADCLPDIVVTAKAKSTESTNNYISEEYYNLFKKYSDNKLYFKNENWKSMFPMLKQNTVDMIISEEIKMFCLFNEYNNTAYFTFSKKGSIDEHIFTLPFIVK